jgi:hypothetical protein
MNVTFAKYDMDTGYVYAKLSDGNIVLIDCTAYEKAYAENMYQRSELDYLIYNDPIGYVELVMEGNPQAYLKAIGNYHGLNVLG